MKKSKLKNRGFRNKTLMPETKDDRVSNRILDNEDCSNENESDEDNESNESSEMSKDDFNLKLFMIVI